MLGSSVSAETQSIIAVSSSACTDVGKADGYALYVATEVVCFAAIYYIAAAGWPHEELCLLLVTSVTWSCKQHEGFCRCRVFLEGHACCCGRSAKCVMSAVERAVSCCPWGPRWLLMQLASPSAKRPCSPALPCCM